MKTITFGSLFAGIHLIVCGINSCQSKKALANEKINGEPQKNDKFNHGQQNHT